MARASNPSWSQLPNEVLHQVLGNLVQLDRLNCRLVCRAWADAPVLKLMFSLDEDFDTDDEDFDEDEEIITPETVSAACSSLALFLGHPGLCSQLRQLGLAGMPGAWSLRSLSTDWMSSLLTLLPSAAPSLRRLMFNQSASNPATLRCWARSLARLPHLSDLHINLFEHPLPLTPFSMLTSLRFLSIVSSTIEADGPAAFLPAAALPHLRALRLFGAVDVAWDKLPSLEALDLDVFRSTSHPLDLTAFAANLLWLSATFDVPDASNVHNLRPLWNPIPPLPRLQALRCRAPTLLHLPPAHLPALKQVSLIYRHDQFILPLPNNLLHYLKGLPALQELRMPPLVDHGGNLSGVGNEVAWMQRLLPHVELKFNRHCHWCQGHSPDDVAEMHYFYQFPVGFPENLQL